MLEAITKVGIEVLIKELPNIIKKIGFSEVKTQRFINNKLQEYITKQFESFSKIRTILHPDRVPFYDIYVPLVLKFSSKTIQTNHVTQVFERSSHITLIGDAGSGKSTLVKHLFLSACSNDDFNIPIVIEFRNLNEYKKDFEQYINDRIFYNQLSMKDINKLLQEGQFVFFLDGYDETKSEAEKRVFQNLKTLVEKYDQNKFLLTSRPYSGAERLPLPFDNYYVQGLSDRDIKLFINKQVRKEFVGRILKSIRTSNQHYIKEFLTNPLLISMYIITFQSYPDVPLKKSVFYRRVYDVLFSRHDSISKFGFVRERKSGLNQDQFEAILKRFSFVTFFDNRFNFEDQYLRKKLNLIKTKLNFEFDIESLIEDLLVGVAIWVEDMGLISFAHRSLQEYFSALCLEGLNEDNKKIVYNKICALFDADSGNMPENFLALCKEVDNLNYYLHLEIPLLRILHSRLRGKNAEVGDSFKLTSMLLEFGFLAMNTHLRVPNRELAKKVIIRLHELDTYVRDLKNSDKNLVEMI